MFRCQILFTKTSSQVGYRGWQTQGGAEKASPHFSWKIKIYNTKGSLSSASPLRVKCRPFFMTMKFNIWWKLRQVIFKVYTMYSLNLILE